MKKKLLIVITACLMCMTLTGCSLFPFNLIKKMTKDPKEETVTENTEDYPVDEGYDNGTGDEYPLDGGYDDGTGDEYPLDGGYDDGTGDTYPTDEYPTDDGSLSGETEPVPPAQDVNVRPAEWASVQWEPYSNAYFTLNVPSGWKVDWNGNAQRMAWMATSPDGKIGVSNIDHNYAAKAKNMQQTLGMNMTLKKGTVKEYFKKMYADTTDYFKVKNSCVPADKDQLQALRPDKAIRDYQSLYATFSENGWEGEGIYSAVIMDSQDIYIRGMNYGIWEINGTFTEWSPLGELINWQPVLAQMLQSFNYTDYYIQEWRSYMNSNDTPTSSVNDEDPVMEAFEERSRSDTIIQEKRSDMIGEYERVYDNDTGEIYRAYNGFLDDIGDQNKYTPITDDQYTEGYVGWIDKD